MLCTSVLDRLQNLTRDVELLFVDDKKMMKIKQFMGIRRFGTGEVRAFLFGCQRGGRTFRTGRHITLRSRRRKTFVLVYI